MLNQKRLNLTKVLLVDDHPLLRNGLRQVISHAPHLTLVGEASTAQAATKSAQELVPDLVVMDIHLPDGSGIDTTREILALRPATKIVIFSADSEREVVDAALRAGALGYILKHSAAAELLQAIDLVLAGRLYLSPEVSADILEAYCQRLGGDSALAVPLLSDREEQLLRLIAEGRRNKEIAAALELSIKSIEAYRSRLMKKTGCGSSAELVRFAIRQGIVQA